MGITNVRKEACKKHFLHVNPYEIPEIVLELMSKICMQQPTAAIDVYWDTIRQAYGKGEDCSLSAYIKANQSNPRCLRFFTQLKGYCRALALHLQARETTQGQEDKEYQPIVVAGSFASGKSSFLNRLTGSVNLLPTGVEPVSVVPTYLFCSRNCEEVRVKGANQRHVIVALDTDVLQVIQHASQTNIYLASVLDKLFVEIPSKLLDGLVFIDTPGYNNSDKINVSNGRTDRETALSTFREAEAMLWLIDSEKGAVETSDWEMLHAFKGKKVVIFNKADKKGMKEATKIVKDASEELYKSFSKKELIDVLAFSTLENKVYYSVNGYSLEKILKQIKSGADATSPVQTLKKQIKELFETEILASKNTIWRHQKRYNEAVKLKGDFFQRYMDDKETNLSFLSKYGNDTGKNIKEKLEKLNNFYKKDCDQASSYCKKLLKKIEKEERLIEAFNTYETQFANAVDQAICAYFRANRPANVVEKEERKNLSLFEAIKKEDFSLFLRCFTQKVDMSQCNKEGYNPLTYAVQTGNNEMVKFMLEHDADPTLKDKRGYNAFHTAVENQYRDLCLLLLDYDHDLVDTATDAGEDVLALSAKINFGEWIRTKCDE